MSELSVPFTFAIPIGERLALTLFTGFARVEMVGESPDSQEPQVISGLVDTEARLGLDLVPIA